MHDSVVVGIMLLLVTPVGVYAASLVAPPLLSQWEDRFSSAPNSVTEGHWLGEFFRSRMYYYFLTSLFVWVVGFGIADVVARAYARSYSADIEKVRQLAEEEKRGGSLATIRVLENIQAQLDERSRRGAEAAEWLARIAAAVALAALSRIWAVQYHPGVIRGIFYGLWSTATIVLLIYVAPNLRQSIEELTVQLSREQLILQFAVLIFMATAVGIFAEFSLVTRARWGREAETAAPPAGYSCIVCGATAAFEERQDGYIVLKPCDHGRHPADSSGSAFFRKTSGW